jgi:hypothetical protein
MEKHYTLLDIEFETQFKLSDKDFEEQFEKSVLDPAIFSHEAHLRLAWIYINKYGLNKALGYIPTQIQNYVQKLGATDKYNHTLTIASIKVVNHFICKSRSVDFAEFILEFPRLKYNFKDLLDCHYSFDIFSSKNAKKRYLEPDLLTF